MFFKFTWHFWSIFFSPSSTFWHLMGTLFSHQAAYTLEYPVMVFCFTFLKKGQRGNVFCPTYQDMLYISRRSRDGAIHGFWIVEIFLLSFCKASARGLKKRFKQATRIVNKAKLKSCIPKIFSSTRDLNVDVNFETHGHSITFKHT